MKVNFSIVFEKEIHESARITANRIPLPGLSQAFGLFVAFANVRRNARLALPALAERRETTQGTSTTERRALA